MHLKIMIENLEADWDGVLIEKANDAGNGD